MENEEEVKFEGKHVILKGLEKAKHYNGRIGVVKGGPTSEGRYPIRLYTINTTLRARARNIEIVPFEVTSEILLNEIANDGRYQLFDYNKFQQCEYASMMRGNIFDGAKDPKEVLCPLPKLDFLLSKPQRDKLRAGKAVGDCFVVYQLLTYVVRASSKTPSSTLDLQYSASLGLDAIIQKCKQFLSLSTRFNAMFFEFSWKGLIWPQVVDFYKKNGLASNPFHSGVILKRGSKYRVIQSFSGLFDLQTSIEKKGWTNDGEGLINALISLAVPKKDGARHIESWTEDLFGFVTSECTGEFFEQKKELGVKFANDLDENKFIDVLGDMLSAMIKATK